MKTLILIIAFAVMQANCSITRAFSIHEPGSFLYEQERQWERMQNQQRRWNQQHQMRQFEQQMQQLQQQMQLQQFEQQRQMQDLLNNCRLLGDC